MSDEQIQQQVTDGQWIMRDFCIYTDLYKHYLCVINVFCDVVENKISTSNVHSPSNQFPLMPQLHLSITDNHIIGYSLRKTNSNVTSHTHEVLGGWNTQLQQKV